MRTFLSITARFFWGASQQTATGGWGVRGGGPVRCLTPQLPHGFRQRRLPLTSPLADSGGG